MRRTGREESVADTAPTTATTTLSEDCSSAPRHADAIALLERTLLDHCYAELGDLCARYVHCICSLLLHLLCEKRREWVWGGRGDLARFVVRGERCARRYWPGKWWRWLPAVLASSLVELTSPSQHTACFQPRPALDMAGLNGVPRGALTTRLILARMARTLRRTCTRTARSGQLSLAACVHPAPIALAPAALHVVLDGARERSS
jgi:hypothetical protein